MKYKRILLKLSGEALAGEKKTGFSEEEIRRVAAEVKKVADLGTEIAVVIGGGNFWRGRTSGDMDRVHADQIGMLATVMNCLYAAEYFRIAGMQCKVMAPYEIGDVAEKFVRDKAVEYLEEKNVVFFAGGTGHPFFSTDMSTVLRAVEIGADIILSAKAIDGVYDKDPKVYPDAVKYDTLRMSELIDKKLGVIDLASAVLAEENHMPMLLFGLNEENSILRAINGDKIGTVVEAD